jgi:hypothetical protein
MKWEMTSGQPQGACGRKPRIPTAALSIVRAESTSSRLDRPKRKLIMKANVKSQASSPWPLKNSARINPSSQYTASVRIPVAPENWAYLRELRHAELEAWNKAQQPGTAPEYTSVAQGLIQINKRSQAESKALLGISVLATATVAYALWDSTQLISHWSQFVKFVGQILA